MEEEFERERERDASRIYELKLLQSLVNFLPFVLEHLVAGEQADRTDLISLTMLYIKYKIIFCMYIIVFESAD